MRTRILPPDDPSFPPALRALAHPDALPPTLYLRGALPALPGVALVGRRDASAEACAFTRALAQGLIASGFSIWSGGALGIDAAAHEASLDARAPTVVVCGGGLDLPYPKEHAPLFDRVLAEGGALLARVPDGTPPRQHQFLARNQVLAALTVATVVIEAGLQSGARSTAAAARRLGRPVCVVPHPPWSERGAGCAEELTCNGARAITCAADVLSVLKDPSAPLSRRRVRPPRLPASAHPLPGETARQITLPSLDPLQQAIFGVLGDQPIHLDVICETVGQPLPVVVGALLTLTLQAVVVEGPAGSYRRGKR